MDFAGAERLSHPRASFRLMERRTRKRRGIHSILDSATPSAPAEALMVQSEGLIKVLERECAELHARRQQVTGTLFEAEMVQRTQYWADVLSWVKSQYANDMIVMRRKR